MAFCRNCGTNVNDGIKFCPSCGSPMEAPGPAAQAKPQDQSDISAKLAALNNTADTTADFDKADIEQNKIMGILAYLSWLVLIPIFAAPNSKFARFHANQGLVLAITEIAWWILTGIVSAILYAISWTLGAIFGTLLGLVNLVFLVLLILGILNAANGKAKELPIIGKFKLLKY